jgi:hypothetical protein
MSSKRQEIVDACAWMLWANAWISLQEDPDREVADRVDPGAGGSWDPYVPDVPAEVTKGAELLIASIERRNGATVDALYDRAVALPGKRYTDREPTPERFGNCIAYVAIGAGVSWADDYPEAGITISEIEVHADSDTQAYVGNVCERFNRTM